MQNEARFGKFRILLEAFSETVKYLALGGDVVDLQACGARNAGVIVFANGVLFASALGSGDLWVRDIS